MVRAYTTFVLPLAEYAAPAFHSMLTIKQTAALERLQIKALKIIYGYGASGEELMRRSGLPTLASRREVLTLNLARKMAASDDLGAFFPEHVPGRSTRASRRYEEVTTTTARLHNSPIFYMQRKLNTIQIPVTTCLLYTSPSPRDGLLSRMPSSA